MRGLPLGCNLPDNDYNRLSIVPDAAGSRMGLGGVGHPPENECLLAMSMAAGLAGLAGVPGPWSDPGIGAVRASFSRCVFWPWLGLRSA
jgi:hypothetical protein